MTSLDIQGCLLEVRRIEGPATRAPIVFLHEGLGSVSLWTQRGLDWPQAVCAATGRAGVVFSRRGYGQSEAVPDVRGPERTVDGRRVGRLAADYMHHEAWEVLPALLEKLAIDNPVLLGHSDGATIALLHASRCAVSACIAMAPHVVVEDFAITAITGARDAFGLSEPGGLRERLARHHADVESAFWQWNDVWLSPAFRHFDIRQDCARITAPLLLVQGVDDEYGTMHQLDEIARAVPRAGQVRLDNCGHSPQRDQPDETRKAVVAFLETAA